MIKKLQQDTVIFSLGGIVYGFIEVLWRHRTHWTMIITGGFCFLVLFKIFIKIQKISTTIKCIIGSFVITTIEFIVGCIVNLKFKMNVWDYSKMPFNLLGQVCPVYSILWGFLTIPIIFVCNKVQKLMNISFNLKIKQTS